MRQRRCRAIGGSSSALAFEVIALERLLEARVLHDEPTGEAFAERYLW
jgi:hypothetical protein